MRFRKLITVLTLSILLAVPFPCLADITSDAGKTAIYTKVVLTLGSSTALLNDTPYQLEIPPEVVEGITFLPIRFVAEQALGATVQWEPEAKMVQITKGDAQIKFSLETGQALVNDQEVELSSPPFIKDGRTLVPLRFLAENFNVQVDYDPVEKTITIIDEIEEVEEPIYLPPVVTSLGLQSDVLKIGEEVKYNFTYENEAGESITAQEWNCQLIGDTQIITGQPRAFFRPGEYILSLRIKDAVGNWSEVATKSFTVSNEKLISEMVFKFSKPIYGELFENMEDVNFSSFTANENTTFKRTGPILHMSNSPEVVSQPGILYQSEASGNFRFFYHHLNGAAERQYLYVIAENDNLYPVTLKTMKSGVGGPINDYMNLGQLVSMRYLTSQPSPALIINPGEKIILNQGLRHLNKGEAVTGMQDYQVDGTITLSVVMGPEKAPEPEPEPDLLPNPPSTPTQDDSPTTGDTTMDDSGVGTNSTGEFNPTNNAGSSDQPTSETASGTTGESNAEIGSDTGTGSGTDSESISKPNDAEDSTAVPVKTPEQILKEKIDYLLSLPVLPRNPQKIRGVFPGADCLVDIQANGSISEKVTLGMEVPGFDSWLEGVDPLTGETIKNFGNYGVVYRVKLTGTEKTGIMLNPRGSIFKAAFQGFDGQVYKAPNIGHFSGLKKAAVLGILEAGQTAEFIYTPPSGSDTPLIIALIPEKYWETFDK